MNEVFKERWLPLAQGAGIVIGLSVSRQPQDAPCDKVDLASRDSFPASDPPGWIAGEVPVNDLRLRRDAF